mgnify:CR=1 FL=1
MHANARVLLFSDQNDSGDLAGKLEQRGYQPLPANSREDALRIVTGRFPDIAIVNAATNGEGARFRQLDWPQASADWGGTNSLRSDDRLGAVESMLEAAPNIVGGSNGHFA